jgi:hypothetical protein
MEWTRQQTFLGSLEAIPSKFQFGPATNNHIMAQIQFTTIESITSTEPLYVPDPDFTFVNAEGTERYVTKNIIKHNQHIF